MTGAELAAHRKAAGLSQVALARLAQVGRHAVQYWEAKGEVHFREWAPTRIARALELPDNLDHYARARGRGLTRRTMPDPWQARLDAEAAAELARLKARLARDAARRRVPCGAQTRKGQPCRLLSEPGRRRCKFHGGKSTGPRTAEGRARIAEAQSRRWAAWRTDLHTEQS